MKKNVFTQRNIGGKPSEKTATGLFMLCSAVENRNIMKVKINQLIQEWQFQENFPPPETKHKDLFTQGSFYYIRLHFSELHRWQKWTNVYFL